MPGKFADSNVVLYLASDDARKSQISDELLRGGSRCFISVQILNEVANVLRRKYRFGWAETRHFLDMVKASCAIVDLSAETHNLGVNLAERYGFSIFDAMIVAAAIRADCETLFSEDMQHGQTVEGSLTIANPYILGI